MSRIPTHTLADAPAASQPLLQKIVEATPGGRPANLHAQMAHSPAVLTAYTSLRAALTKHASFDPKVGAALTLAAASGVGNDYMIRIASRIAGMNGWTEQQIAALATDSPTTDAKTDALASLVREAATNAGNVSDAAWETARQAGWSVGQLADAFAYLGATIFTATFLNFAQTDPDL
ncbi:hypothetical protein [Sphingobium sp. EM0848]|uniref:hypothetical protein n=1 Tax=Sphingobium sp. EM0848 TaxID=2743473 RepID=UPI00159C4ABE|nr:hypothetical protein [Sphingobium sp. EM0848]